MSTVDKCQGVRHDSINRFRLFNENESLFFICNIVFLICSLMGNQCSFGQRIRDIVYISALCKPPSTQNAS